MPTLDKTIKIIHKYHYEHKDKAGYPYILHLYVVMRKMKTNKDKIVALLHDIIEDTDCTFDKLKELGYSQEIIDSVDAITRRDKEKYEDYINRVMLNDRARKIKIEDVRHNLRPDRLNMLSDKDRVRLKKKYEYALSRLEGVDNK